MPIGPEYPLAQMVRSKLEVEGPLPQRQDLAAVAVALFFHPVQADGAQIRQHLVEQRTEAVEMFVAVMQVVDDPDVVNSLTSSIAR